MSNAPGRPKIDFNSLPVPRGYVPGLGRGATGFTTRSDIGPAKFTPGQGAGQDGGAQEGAQEAQKPMVQSNKFEEQDAGMFAGGAYEDDDKEADQVWEKIDEHMDERRREQREKRLQEDLEKYRKENPKITEQFKDLKRKLAEVSYEEWDAIPEIGDYTIKKQKKFESFAPVSDKLLTGAASAAAGATGKVADDGLTTPAGTMTNLTAVGQGRSTVLSLKLDRMADSVDGQTSVDPKGFLTAMGSQKVSSDMEISDLKRARLLFKSIIQTNPTNYTGWIGAARLEVQAGNPQAARNLIMKGCEACPGSEDVWLEAARLQQGENAKAVLARGVAANPESVNLWLEAAQLETDDAAKSRVLRKALERVPTSVRLWKAAVELASEEDAKVLLSRAVECCPQHPELWLALARLETYENARKVLNKARQSIPTEVSIWLHAAKLEETHGSDAMPGKIIPRAIKSLQANGVVIDRDAWLKEAEACERLDPPLRHTCRAIVAAVVGLGVEDTDRKRTWIADAEEFQRAGSFETARAIFAAALEVYPHKKGVWRRAAMLEKAAGDVEAMDELLRRGVQHCPQAEVLWLIAAREKWRTTHDVAAARLVLSEAFKANPSSEEIWLAAFKLEFESGELDRARAILAKARESEAARTARVWMKAAIVERAAGDAAAEREVLKQGLDAFPDFPKLWLMLAQLEVRCGHRDAARRTLAAAVAKCPQSVPVWREYAALEAAEGNFGKARAILEQARLKNPAQEALWVAAVRVELRANNAKAAEVTLAKGLQQCPKSGRLWAIATQLAPQKQRRGKCSEGLKRCDQDPYIVVEAAKLFWAERKVDKARQWMSRAVAAAPDNGDIWAQLYKLELQHGDETTQRAVVEKCAQAAPRYGECWIRVAKDPAAHGLSEETILARVVPLLDQDPPI
ncbi:unnamed protein product [Pedinophyceae sp. YPF-701]|nr:unnamed protein product [Pedinophyceae sp. YPF-701]